MTRLSSLLSIISCLLLILVCLSSEATTNGSDSMYPVNYGIEFDVDVGSGINFHVASMSFPNKLTNDFSTDIQITSSANAWIGIMIGTQMIGSTALIGLDATNPTNQNLHLNSVNLYSLNSKTGDPSKDVIPFSSSLTQNGITKVSFAVLGGKSVLNFTITQSAAFQTFPLLGDGLGSMVDVAFVSGSSQALNIQQSFAFRTLALSATQNGGARIPNAVPLATRPVDLLLAFHISLQIASWLFILPSGAIIAITRFRRGPKVTNSWIKYHMTLQVTGVLLSFAAWCAGIAHVQSLPTPHFSRSHHIFGYIIGVFAMTQIVNALFMRPAESEPGEPQTKKRKRWGLVHRILCSILLLNGLTNAIVGSSTLFDVFGDNTTLVFPTGSTILVNQLAAFIRGMVGICFIAIFFAVLVDPYRKYKERKAQAQQNNAGDLDRAYPYPEKPLNEFEDPNASEAKPFSFGSPSNFRLPSFRNPNTSFRQPKPENNMVDSQMSEEKPFSFGMTPAAFRLPSFRNPQTVSKPPKRFEDSNMAEDKPFSFGMTPQAFRLPSYQTSESSKQSKFDSGSDPYSSTPQSSTSSQPSGFRLPPVTQQPSQSRLPPMPPSATAKPKFAASSGAPFDMPKPVPKPSFNNLPPAPVVNMPKPPSFGTPLQATSNAPNYKKGVTLPLPDV